MLAGTSTSVTGAAGFTVGVTALLFPNPERATGTETKTKGTLSPVSPGNTSKERMATLPTPININELGKVLKEHPDLIFVTKAVVILKLGLILATFVPTLQVFKTFTHSFSTA